MDAGTPEAQADAGTPEIEVDAGTPEIEVDAGNGPSEMDAGVVLPFCGDGITDSDNGEDCDDGNDIDYDSCTNSCNYGKVIIYDPLVPFLPIQTGSLLFSGGTLATEFTTSFASELVSVDYFVFANENLSFRVDVLDVTNASPDSLWSETHTDVNECRDWCRCRFTLTDEVSGLQCTSMATNAGIYNFGDVAPMAGNGINLSNESTYEIKSAYESDSSGASVLFRAFDPSQTQATADPSYKTGDGSDARTVTSRRVQSNGDNEFPESYNAAIHLHHRMEPTNDKDQDGILNSQDLCPYAYNPGHADTDTDNDGIGDICDFGDADGDGMGPLSDFCPTGSSRLLSDNDGDGCADISEDLDDDNDSILDSNDNCPLVWNKGFPQPNADGDDLGDACDPDDDNDGIVDDVDNCPFVFNADQQNSDSDILGNACDPSWCGNGELNADDGEICDDGNDRDQDRCTNSCTLGPQLVYDPIIPYLPNYLSNSASEDNEMPSSYFLSTQSFYVDFNPATTMKWAEFSYFTSSNDVDDVQKLTVNLWAKASGSSDFIQVFSDAIEYGLTTLKLYQCRVNVSATGFGGVLCELPQEAGFDFLRDTPNADTDYTFVDGSTYRLEIVVGENPVNFALYHDLTAVGLPSYKNGDNRVVASKKVYSAQVAIDMSPMLHFLRKPLTIDATVTGTTDDDADGTPNWQIYVRELIRPRRRLKTKITMVLGTPAILVMPIMTERGNSKTPVLRAHRIYPTTKMVTVVRTMKI